MPNQLIKAVISDCVLTLHKHTFDSRDIFDPQEKYVKVLPACTWSIPLFASFCVAS